jgi:hypothetical protein
VPRSSFSITEDKVSILFRYFEVLNVLISLVDKLKVENELLRKSLKIGFVALVILFNYILILHKSFLKVVMFIVMINYTRSVFKKQDLENMTICIKRW